MASFLLSSPSSLDAEPAPLRVLTVTGQGTERVATTLAQVDLGVEVRAETAAAAQAETARLSNQVVDFLRSRAVEKLETTGVRLQADYDYRDNQRRLRGYVGTNTVRFRLPTEQAGAVLDQAVSAGATRIDNVSFIAGDAALAAAQKAALQKATADAQAQAQTVLGALKLQAQSIIQITLDGAPPPEGPRPMFAARADALAAAPPTPVIGGEQTVQASVTLQITFRD
ncbi:MAG: SIMPL domain-containing protein [Cyanobacteriota bacterium]|nr:SIMPL domain-containing protein [Cyanobacteriota bacterium]